MADKNFARSGTADTDLLADDDPLSELARLVGFDTPQVQPVRQTLSEGAQPVPRRENPVLALEDELMRAFDQYDTPGRPAVAPMLPADASLAEQPAARYAEPLLEVPEPVVASPEPIVEDRAASTDEAADRDVPAIDPPVEEFSAHDAAPVHHDDSTVEPDFAQSIAEEVQAESDPVSDHFEPEYDPSLMLADELEAAVPAVEAEPVHHAGRDFAERLEPRFEPTAHRDPVSESDFSANPAASEPVAREPEFLGWQPTSGQESIADEIGLDLERELELSIGDGFADDLSVDAREPHIDANFVEPLPVSVEADAVALEPHIEGWNVQETAPRDAEPFHAAPVYAREEPHFVAEMPYETREDHARAVAEAEARWMADAGTPTFAAEPDYQVTSVEKGQDYDHDALLAEVERYPVPETRSPLAGAAVSAVVSSSMANISSIFGRATPFAHRGVQSGKIHQAEPALEPTMEPAFEAAFETARKPAEEPYRAPPVETRREPVVAEPVAQDPEFDLDNLEIELADLALDLSDISLDEEPVRSEARAEAVKPAEIKPAVLETPVRREPAVAVPVSTYTTPQPVAAEMNDGTLPFDPAMIADTDEGVAPVTEVDVPQLPAVEKERPAAFQPDYEFDIDAEMAQLFTEPAPAATRTEALQAGVSAGAVAASLSQPASQFAEVDDFERALEEDFRRSLNQPERMAIPVDPGQGGMVYAGDGYDDEPARPRRGLLIAASIAGLFLIGGGGVYAWTTFSGGAAGSGEPRVIMADKAPIKVVPEEKGGKTVPNQDKAVYDRVAGDSASTPQQEQLVTSTEEPVDVVQRTLTPETLPFDGPEDEIAAAASTPDDEGRLLPGVDEPETATADGANKPLVSPRKVKTMIVKPDGTLVAREETVSEPAAEVAAIDAKATATTGSASAGAAATANAAIDADVPLSVEQAAAEGQPRSALAEAAAADVEEAAPVRTVKTTAIDGTAAGANTPVPETRPADQPVNVVGTVTENGNVSGTTTTTAEATPTVAETKPAAEATQVAAVAPGSYVIQIASLPSEAEAQKSYSNLSSKFSGVIGGRGVDIKKAEIPNKGTYFRVRIPAGSREEANSLCNRYKSAGGSCLVTR
jgi:hypothetical protein